MDLLRANPAAINRYHTGVLAMSKSETQLTLHEQVDDLWKDIALDWYGSLEPETEKMAKFLENYTDQVTTLFTQALTSLKTEMEKKKKPELKKRIHTLIEADRNEGWNLAISECQRVIDQMASSRKV